MSESSVEVKIRFDAPERVNTMKLSPYCSTCKTYYSCSSSFYLHIRNKHQGRIPNGSIGGSRYHKSVFVQRMEPKQEKSQQITPQLPSGNKCVCGNHYTTRGALVYHIRVKHDSTDVTKYISTHPDSQDLKHPFITYDSATFLFYCQCGLTLQSPAALKKHISRYHKKRRFKCYCGAVYSTPSARNLHCRLKGHGNGETQVIANQKKEIFEEEIKESRKIERSIFRCGCGTRYTTSSALNLHIRTKHSSKVDHTIVGKKGIYINGEYHILTEDIYKKVIPIEEQKQYQTILLKESEEISHQFDEYQTNPQCMECKMEKKGINYYECNCNSIPKHLICEQCFWETNQFQNQHKEWAIRNPKLKEQKNRQLNESKVQKDPTQLLYFQEELKSQQQN